MYRPKHFDVRSTERMHAMIREYPFGALVSTGESGFVASHLPFTLDPERGALGRLSGHFARANDQWRGFDGDAEALVLFQGPHAYVSPAWMSGARNVPTWNYIAVHVFGRPRIIDDPEIARARLESLVAANEAFRATPWTTGDAPADFVDAMVGGIVAFDLPIDRLEGKWKLSQNKTETDRRGAIEGLETEGGPAGCDVAREMRREM